MEDKKYSKLAREEHLTVQKSLPLFSLWKSKLTLAEFKILDTYLARIDSHKPEIRTVVFEKGELEKLLGVDRIRTEELDKRLTHLGTPVRIDDDSSEYKKFSRICLFEKAVAEQDALGIWKVELTASESAMQYFFNIENLGYLRYKLRCITSLSSRYTYIMFMYLESNRYRKTWDVSLEDLKKILNCDEDYAKEFKYFNRDVLKRIHTEMNEKTECKYTYDPIKKGRTVVGIRFRVKAIKEVIPKQEVMIVQQQKELWKDALVGANFSDKQLNEIKALIDTVPAEKMPDEGHGTEINQYHYIAQKWAKMEAQSNVKNKFAYFCKMIEQDAKAE